MALPTIILNNQTASPIDLVQLAVTVPASGSVTVSDFNLTDEILIDEQLQSELAAGNLTVTYNGVTLTIEQSKAKILPQQALDILHNLTAVTNPGVTDDADAGYSAGSIWINVTPSAPAAWQCLIATAGAAVWVSNGTNGGSQLVWGADQVSSTTSIRYLYPGYAPAIAQTSPIPQRVSRSGTMKNMVIAQIGDGNGTNLTYTLRINGAPTALAVTMASTDNTASNLADQVAVSAEDLVDIQVTKAGGLGSSPDEVTCNIEFA